MFKRQINTSVSGGILLGLLSWDGSAIPISEPQQTLSSDQTFIMQSKQRLRLAESGVITPTQKQTLQYIAKQIINSTDRNIVLANWSAFIVSATQEGSAFNARTYIHSLIAEIDAIQRGYFESTHASMRIFDQRKRQLQIQLDQARTQGNSKLSHQLMTRLQANKTGLQVASTNHQNTRQKHQQLLQSMLDISKMLHETAMTVIRNRSH